MADESKKRTIQKLKELLQLKKRTITEEEIQIDFTEELVDYDIPNHSIYGYECETEDEYDERMLLRITGSDKLPFIVQNPTNYTHAQLLQQKIESESKGHPFIIPSLIISENRNSEYHFTPYIIFFTHDKKIFVYPCDNTEFTDMDI